MCKTAKMSEDAAEKSMTAMTHIYSHNRRVIVNRHSKTDLFMYSGLKQCWLMNTVSVSSVRAEVGGRL